LTATAFLWIITDGIIPGVHIEPAVIGLMLVLFIHLPEPIGVSDPAALKSTSSFGAMLLVATLLAISESFRKSHAIDGVIATIATSNSFGHAFDAFAPPLQYMIIAWSVEIIGCALSASLAASIGSLFWLKYVTHPGYSGQLNVFTVALATCLPGASAFSPFQLPSLMVGINAYKGSLDSGRMHRYLAYLSAVEMLVFVPLSALMLAALSPR